MPKFIRNKNAQSAGEHEVHNLYTGCKNLYRQKSYRIRFSLSLPKCDCLRKGCVFKQSN